MLPQKGYKNVMVLTSGTLPILGFRPPYIGATAGEAAIDGEYPLLTGK